MTLQNCRSFDSVTDGSYTDTLDITVAIADINDNAPEFDNTEYTATVYEGINQGSVVYV